MPDFRLRREIKSDYMQPDHGAYRVTHVRVMTWKKLGREDGK